MYHIIGTVVQLASDERFIKKCIRSIFEIGQNRKKIREQIYLRNAQWAWFSYALFEWVNKNFFLLIYRILHLDTRIKTKRLKCHLSITTVISTAERITMAKFRYVSKIFRGSKPCSEDELEK